MHAGRIIKAIERQESQIANQIKRTGQQDAEQESFLLESFAIELARKPRQGSVPLTFASYSPEDGLVMVAGTTEATATVRSN